MYLNTIIIYDSVKFFIPEFKKNKIRVYRLYKKDGFIFKVVRRISFLLNIKGFQFYDDWIIDIKKNKIQNVILFANNASDIWSVLEQLEINIFFWYWNPVSLYKIGRPNNLPKSFKVFSFDPDDCIKYNIKFNTTFYFKSIVLSKQNIKYDILFVGLDKGRKEYLKDLEKDFDSLGLSSYIYIAGIRNKMGMRIGNKHVSYGDYLKLIAKSKAILDIVQDRQTGLTLRVMESLFFSKKLITNNLEIANLPFYNPSNIFILNKDRLNDLNKFLDAKYVPVTDEILSFYDVSQWIKRFD